MKIAFLVSTLLALTSAAYAQSPQFLVLPSSNSATIRLTPGALYQNATAISYAITHWPDGAELAKGQVDAQQIKPDASELPSFVIDGLKPKLWSANDPQLYSIELKDSGGRSIGKIRFGFRTFEVKGNRFYLNGVPIFLRGFPINPPGRDLPESTGTDPEFIRGYLRLVKASHANLMRTDKQAWLDACDEIGILTFQGDYGPAPGGTASVPPPYDSARPRYRELFSTLANHPSVVIYVLTNEVTYKNNRPYVDLLTKVREDIALFDPTRLVIGNAGFGHGEPGEIYDLHPYTGWYNGNINEWCASYPRYLADAAKTGKPLTLSECVGAYTSDAGLFLTMSKQLVTMMRWNGPVTDQKTASLDYQARLVKNVAEIGRRSRTAETGPASIMPFTYLLGWASAHKPADLIIKPAYEAMKTAFQPVLISPDCWRTNIYAGDTLRMRLCVVNDDDLGRNLAPSTATVDIADSSAKVIASGQASFAEVPYYASAWKELSIDIPAGTQRGDYNVRVRLSEGGKQTSENALEITVAPRSWAKSSCAEVMLYDPKATTAGALRAIGVATKSVGSLSGLPDGGMLVIGEEALDEKSREARANISAFLARGGRVLCLRQTAEAIHARTLPLDFTNYGGATDRRLTYIHPVGGNEAIFDGIRDRDLRFWNETERSPDGTPDVYPVITPVRPSSVEALQSARIWALCDQGLGGAAIVEKLADRGRLIVSQFRCASRAADDPIAAKLLANLIDYAASPDNAKPIDLSQPINWGMDAIASGAFGSPSQGFLLHSKTYQHTGSSKGMLGADHSIDGVTLLGQYTHNAKGWIDPVPDPTTEGWGVVFGTLPQTAKRLIVKVRNPSDSPASMRIELDGKRIGSRISLQPGSEVESAWDVNRAPGPVRLEFAGSQELVLVSSRFE